MIVAVCEASDRGFTSGNNADNEKGNMMNDLNRGEMIDWLVDDDIATIKEGIYANDFSYLTDILIFGKSYQDWSDDELQAEIYERELDIKGV